MSHYFKTCTCVNHKKLTNHPYKLTLEELNDTVCVFFVELVKLQVLKQTS